MDSNILCHIWIPRFGRISAYVRDHWNQQFRNLQSDLAFYRLRTRNPRRTKRTKTPKEPKEPGTQKDPRIHGMLAPLEYQNPENVATQREKSGDLLLLLWKQFLREWCCCCHCCWCFCCYFCCTLGFFHFRENPSGEGVESGTSGMKKTWTEFWAAKTWLRWYGEIQSPPGPPLCSTPGLCQSRDMLLWIMFFEKILFCRVFCQSREMHSETPLGPPLGGPNYGSTSPAICSQVFAKWTFYINAQFV